jgi:eukaryotic-like serine/threonine-protein kinase
MSEPVEGTRGQSAEDVKRLTPVVFLAGEKVPGLSSWVLEHKLGGGGFGEVWLARHEWDAEQKPRAVKFCTDPEARHRLVTHEKNVVVRVMKYAGKHPHIVPLLDCNLDGDVPWLMYEFVQGGTLTSLIDQWRGVPLWERIETVVRALHAIASGLAVCHRLSPPLVHRDMKPHNILMAGSVPRIADFGIGGVVVQKDAATTGGLTAYAARLPTALQSAGTRLYAPQEQLYGSPPHPRDDVYALGIIAYQMLLADRKAVPGVDAALELRGLRVPDALEMLILKSVSINPERRPADAGEWEAGLGRLLPPAPPGPTPEPPAPAPPPIPLPSAETVRPSGPTEVSPPEVEPDKEGDQPTAPEQSEEHEKRAVRVRKRIETGAMAGMVLGVLVGVAIGFATGGTAAAIIGGVFGWFAGAAIGAAVGWLLRGPVTPLDIADRGWEAYESEDYARAIELLQKALERDPALVVALNNLAWLWATCPEDEHRNGAGAVECARRACELRGWKKAYLLDTLATAYAEAGQFGEAVRWARRAYELAPTRRKLAYIQRMELFAAGKPYRTHSEDY